MFTGLVEEVGTIDSIRPRGDGATLRIHASVVTDEVKLGDSIAISGACQTVIEFGKDYFVVEAIRETMNRTKFASWKQGDPVNLERAMRPMDRLGGHLVQGHVDGLSEVLSIQPLKGSWRLKLKHSEAGKPFIVEKGSIALDGVSLTVASVDSISFDVEIIPHTWQQTTLHLLKPGNKIHVEWDLIGKYVAHMLKGYTGDSGITAEKLFSAGFGS